MIALAPAVRATPAFVNGLALPATLLDLSGGTSVNTGRVGFFSDIYFDPNRREWWGLSDRGPGGGTLDYATRVQRFTLDVDSNTGAIANFKIVDTVIFNGPGGVPFNGQAPSPASVLGNAFDPEGFVVHPLTGNLIVSDEYGASVYEFTRAGALVRQYTTPENIKPTTSPGVYNYDPDANSAGRRINRGFEGLALSPDGRYAYAMLQSAMVNEGGGNGVFAPDRQVRHRDRHRGRAVRVPDGGLEPGPRHLGAGRAQRSRVPRPRAQQPRPRLGVRADAAEQEGLQDRHRRRRRRQQRRPGRHDLCRPDGDQDGDAFHRPRRRHAGRARRHRSREVGRASRSGRASTTAAS